MTLRKSELALLCHWRFFIFLSSIFIVRSRSRRKSETIRRRKVKPCLAVCQTVEEQCPYMLPADRAPAYPTQYAGEPTFLCLGKFPIHPFYLCLSIHTECIVFSTIVIFFPIDLNIPETGDQLIKSNNGIDICCYHYCGTVFDGICAHCEIPTEQDANDSTSLELEQQSHITTVSTMVCQSVNTPTSKCTAPYYASSSSSIFKASSITINTNVHFWWTTSWSFLILNIINNTMAAWRRMLSFQFAVL